MSEASRDQNHVPTALGVSSVDSVTPTPFVVNPVTGRLLTDVSGGGSGTVTDVSVVTANGISGSVATSTTTPAITLSTTITGILKGNGTAISAATDGTDYLSSTTGLKLDQTSAQTITNDTPIFNTLTASELVATTAAKKLQSLAVATYPSLTELSYVKGVTSSIQTQINAKGAGTVTAVSVATANGVSGSSSGGATPALTITLGAITPTTVNGNTFTTGSSTYTGTAAAIYTFPGASKTIAANDGSNWTFTSQAIGDLVYASSTTAFTRLAAVAAGQVLVSAGIGTAPAYSANPSVTTLELGAGQTDTTLSRSAAGVLAVEGVVIPSISSTNTLTNKRVNPRFTTATSYTTSTTIDSDANDQYIITAQAGALLFNNPTGTPVDGQKLIIAVTGTAARALTWGTAFEASTVALPTTTVTTARLNIGFIWRADTSKWVCVAVA